LKVRKFRQGEGDECLLRVAELGKNRHRERLFRRLLGLWEFARLAAQVGEALLKVKRDRVVDRAADLPLGKLLLQRVPAAAGDAASLPSPGTTMPPSPKPPRFFEGKNE